MNCPSCGAPHTAEDRFCSSCGSALSESCDQCGTLLRPDSEVCPTCGALPRILGRLRERKVATILFADIAGATALGEALDVERLQELMAEFYQVMGEEVEAMGGVVDTFVGDAVMAVFGVPVAHEDDPDRALATAWRMFARLEHLNATLFAPEGFSLEIRIGVNTGEVLVEATDAPDLGRMTGDAVNVAARLQEHASPGTALIAGRTASAVSKHHLRREQSVMLRGRSKPVTVFELGPPIEVVAPSAFLGAPMIGRDHEMSLLEALYDRVVREGVPHFVTVYGPAGVGKSRLAAEVLDRLGRPRPTPTVLTGRCRPYGETVTYGALAEIIKESASVLDGDSPQHALSKVVKLARSLRPDAAPGELDRVAEALAHTAGISSEESALPNMSPRQIRVEIRNAWRWFFSISAQEGPVAVLIEDIHWADPALLDLLEDLADRLEGSVLFLCPARPQLTDSRPGWGGGRKNFSSILLDPLTPEESATLLGHLMLSDTVPDAIRVRILERAEGNPFFMEEIIRSLVDAGTIARTAEGLRAVTDGAEVQIPDTVHGAIAARIDLLDPDQKRALQCAAVVGRSFWSGSLAYLLQWDEAQVEEVLDTLEQRDLIVARLDSGIREGREYRFRHVLIRDVAYESLSRRDRTSIHRWVAEWLTRSAGQGRADVVGLRAHHLTNAYDGMVAQGDREAESVRGHALAALLEASAQAKRRVALGEAKHFAREARRLAATKAEESSAVEALGEAFFFGYEGDAAWQHLRDAVDLLLASNDPDPDDVARICARALEMPVRWPGAMLSPPAEATVARYLSIGMSHVVDPGGVDAVRLLTMKAFWQHAFPKAEPPVIGPAEALRSGEEAVEAARRLGRADLESAALDGVSACFIPLGAYREALGPAIRRLELIDDLHDLWEIGDTFAMNSWTRFHIGQYKETFEYANEGFSRTVGEAPSLALHCLRWRAQARFRLGDWPAVVEDYRLARRLLGEHKDVPPHYVSPIFGTAALVHEIREEHADADAILEILRRRFEASAPADRDTLPLSRWAEFVAIVLGRRNRPAEARELLDETAWRRTGRLGLLLEAAMEIAADHGDWEWAQDSARQAGALAREREFDGLEIAARVTSGRIALAEGDAAGAVGLLESAVTSFQGLGAVWERAKAQLHLTQALAAADRRPDAVAVIEDALPALEGLGARRETDTARDLLRDLL